MKGREQVVEEADETVSQCPLTPFSGPTYHRQVSRSIEAIRWDDDDMFITVAWASLMRCNEKRRRSFALETEQTEKATRLE